jgi:hypothetical protein
VTASPLNRRVATSVIVLALTAIASPVPARAAFPGTNGRLAVVVRAGDATGGRLVTVAVDGTQTRVLARRATSVHWSADGRRLAVGLPCVRSGCGDNVGGPAGPAALQVIEADSGRSVRIHTGRSLAFEGPIAPAWTPGGRLLWIRHAPVEAGASEMVLADHRGRRQRIVRVDGPVFTAFARAAPTGGLVAVAVSSPSGRLLVVPAAGGPQRELIGCPVPSPENPYPECPPIRTLDWSPDGATIAFEVVGARSIPTIRTIDVTTGEIRDVRAGRAPFWSPDGLRLGSISAGHRVEIGPPAPGHTKLHGPRGAATADWQPRRSGHATAVAGDG